MHTATQTDPLEAVIHSELSEHSTAEPIVDAVDASGFACEETSSACVGCRTSLDVRD